MEVIPKSSELPQKSQFERYGGGKATLESVTGDHITEADITRIATICNQPKVQKWVTHRYSTGLHGRYTDKDAHTFVKAANEGWAQQNSFSYLVRDEHDEIVGTIGIRSSNRDEAEVGYWADTGEGQTGYMTNALSRLCDLAAEAGYTRLSAYAMPENDPSRNLLERGGFDEEGPVPYQRGGDNTEVIAVRYVKNL